MLQLRLDKLKNQYEFLLDKDLSQPSTSTETSDATESSESTDSSQGGPKIDKSEIKKRQKPDSKASDFDVGYTMISEHDGNTYEVKLIEPKKKSSQLTTSYKRWFLKNKN